MESCSFLLHAKTRTDLSENESSLNQSLIKLINVFYKHREFWMGTTCHKTYENVQQYFSLFIDLYSMMHSSEDQMKKIVFTLYKKDIHVLSIIKSLKSPRKRSKDEYIGSEIIRNDLPNDIKIVKLELNNVFHKMTLFMREINSTK